ncbi:MAG: hypothetical protein ACXVCY_16715 [Pseudobdellovibrionaceae bacterium]
MDSGKSIIYKTPQRQNEKQDSRDNRKFYQYSNENDKILQSIEEDKKYDDTKRTGQREWEEEYNKYDNEEDLGEDFGKP